MSYGRRHIGTVDMFDETKGYGFIIVDKGGDTVFVRFTTIGEAFCTLSIGDKVAFNIEVCAKGSLAVKVARVP